MEFGEATVRSRLLVLVPSNPKNTGMSFIVADLVGCSSSDLGFSCRPLCSLAGLFLYGIKPRRRRKGDIGAEIYTGTLAVVQF